MKNSLYRKEKKKEKNIKFMMHNRNQKLEITKL